MTGAPTCAIGTLYRLPRTATSATARPAAPPAHASRGCVHAGHRTGSERRHAPDGRSEHLRSFGRVGIGRAAQSRRHSTAEFRASSPRKGTPRPVAGQDRFGDHHQQRKQDHNRRRVWRARKHKRQLRNRAKQEPCGEPERTARGRAEQEQAGEHQNQCIPEEGVIAISNPLMSVAETALGMSPLRITSHAAGTTHTPAASSQTLGEGWRRVRGDSACRRSGGW